MRFNPAAFKTAQARATGGATATAVCEPAPGEQFPQTPDARPDPLSAWLLAFARPGAAPVAVPLDRLAVTLTLKFNDSAPQVDHFDYHSHLGCPAFLLLLAKKGNRCEALARKALALCPELHRLDWQWHTENYAGGHGNYLISSPIILPLPARGFPVHSYCQAEVQPFWEIEFTASHPGHLLELWPHKHYGDKSIIPDSQSPDPRPMHHYRRLEFQRPTQRRGNPLHPPAR